MISRPDLSVDLREKMRKKRRRKRGTRGRGKAVVALNIGIILHHLTLSLHIMFKLSPGNVQRGGGREVKGDLVGAEGQI